MYADTARLYLCSALTPKSGQAINSSSAGRDEIVDKHNSCDIVTLT